jgi:hypothetical protein
MKKSKILLLTSILLTGATAGAPTLMLPNKDIDYQNIKILIFQITIIKTLI